MAHWRPDPTFYSSPQIAMEVPAEQLVYVVTLNTDGNRSDALCVLDVAPGSSTRGQAVGRLDTPLHLGPKQQFALELRPWHDPMKTYGFVNAVVLPLTSSVRLGGIVSHGAHPAPA